jgi:hypothetical protein
LKAAQAFMILGMMALIGAVAVVAIIAFVPDFEGDFRILGGGVAITGISGISLLSFVGIMINLICFLVALFTMIAVGSFGARYQEYFSTRDMAMWGENTGELYWAWGIALTGFLINVIALGCLIVEVVSGSRDAY